MKNLFKIWLPVVFIMTYSTIRPVTPDHDKNILEIINAVNQNIHAGIAIATIDAQLKTPELYYEKNAKKLFVPASNMKILTALAAFHYLKPDFTFKTSIYTDGNISNNTLSGNLYLKGDGDPSFSVDHLEQLVLELKKQNIMTITGDICLDNSCFDTVQFGPGCAWDDGAASWNAPIDGLNINHNSIIITVSPSSGPDTHVNTRTMYSVSPAYAQSFVKIHNHSTTTPTQNPITLSVTRRWQHRENTIDITGEIPNTVTFFEETVSIENPALYAGHLLSRLLAKYKITYSGTLKIRKISSQAIVLAHHDSKPLHVLIDRMLSASDNLYADAIFKKIGSFYASAPGSFARGTQAIKKFLVQELNFASDECVVVDGSGLSRYNLLSPQQILKLLLWGAQSPYASYFTKALAVSGQKGTLLNRLKKLPGSVSAKTGTISGVSGLSGYLQRPDGTLLAFSFLLNGFVQPANKTAVSLGLPTHSPKTIDYKAQVEDELCYYFAAC